MRRERERARAGGSHDYSVSSIDMLPSVENLCIYSIQWMYIREVGSCLILASLLLHELPSCDDFHHANGFGQRTHEVILREAILLQEVLRGEWMTNKQKGRV